MDKKIKKANTNQSIENFDYNTDYYDDDQDFHIRTVDEEMLIIPNEGLDDQEEFICNMHNFGDSDDMPISDRAMLSSHQRCDYP